MPNESVLITGASSGIGRASAILLSQHGYNCVITGRSEDKLLETFNQLNSGDHRMIAGDITESTTIDAITNSIEKINGVLHCAGAIKLVPYKFITKNDFHKIIDLNLFVPFFLTQNLLKRNKLADGGSVLFISSISGSIIGSKGNLMYSASKSAIDGLVKTLALELSGRKIRVNSINAGMVRSEMWQNEITITNEQMALDEAKYPLGHGSVEDVAAFAYFLISNSSKWITGSNLKADGGFTIQ